MDAQAVEIYEDLANENEEIRLKAAQALLTKVSSEKSPSLEALQKILKRLFRGLSSSRKAARLGFSVALTEFLRQHCVSHQMDRPVLEVAAVVNVLEEQTRPSAGVSGQVNIIPRYPNLLRAHVCLGRARSLSRTTVWC